MLWETETMDATAWAAELFDRVMGEPQEEADAVVEIPDVVEWAEDRFYITETKRPIVLKPVQREVLRAFSERLDDGRFRWKTCLYSTIKKSGKTTIAGLYQRWAAECWGDFGEIFHLGNKQKQAQERAFKFTRYSIQLAPKQERAEWDIQSLKMTYMPNDSFIQALPVNAAGEAGGNQRLTTWTELHGYVYEENERMFAEMQPVPTQLLSQRFCESYAGYEGESMLLWRLWETGLGGERLHDEYPIFGNEAAGMIAYIDQGIEARRMPWQVGDIGRKYYAEQQRNELPHEFDRVHNNVWVNAQNAFIEVAMWDGLEGPSLIPPKHGGETGIVRVVIGADASVSGDCTALSVVAYDPDGDVVEEIATFIWEPSGGMKLDYALTLKPELKRWLDSPPLTHPKHGGEIRGVQVVCVAYDEYQLHDVMTQIAKDYRKSLFYAFPQGGERLKADTSLLNRIRHGKLMHSGNHRLREHVQNADGKASGDSAIRIVKRKENKPVDGLVALSMAAWKAAELLAKAEGQVVRRARAKYSHSSQRRRRR